MSDPIKWLDRDDGPVNYGEPTYWEGRYERDRKEFGTGYRHDWYFGHDKLKTTFESYFGQPKGQRILVVGCGLSTIASQMHTLGYRCITAIDISPTAITLMQAGEQDKEGVEYVVGDARKMDSLPDNLFEGIFDKGCVDSLVCGYRSTDDVLDMFRECCRVLRPSGVFLCVSHAPPDARMHMFEHQGLQWRTNVIPVHESEGLSVYVSTKWTQEEIEEAERMRLDDLESIMSMRARSTFSHSTLSRPGIINENLILHAMAPHQIDAIKEKREKKAADKKRAAGEAAAKAADDAEKTAASEAGKAAAESTTVVPFKVTYGTQQGITTVLTPTTNNTSSSDSHGAGVCEKPRTALAGSSDESAASVVDSLNVDGLKWGGCSISGDSPTLVSSITTTSEDIPANFAASG